nr:alcohol dehydrogenase, C-terminal [Tanacetum cinerariifolium]
MSYARQLKRLILNGELVHSLTSCNDWEKRKCLNERDITDLDMSVVEIWEQMDDLKDTNFFVDLGRDHSVSYSHVIAAELGGFIHILGEIGDIIYSFHVKDNTISLLHTPSPMLPSSHVSLWEYRFEDDHGETKCIDSKVEMENNDEILSKPVKHNGVESSESHLLNILFNILDPIIEHCVGVEYMNLRATCRQCHLALPLIKWSKETSLKRLEMYSTVSPWFVVLNRKQGIITFTDPMLGENYLMKNAQEPSWRPVRHNQRPIDSLTFYGGDLYALCKEGGLIVFSNLGKENYSRKVVEAEAPE